ncbi:hypothetical protein N7478_001734 [Penicillium angulare]|uniref:uncharacterized protein n=1 Tax=Penicillium angulare TaxID=116970 RepID=UPI00253F831D|nr:uncharacterized protein N7478_001734 [Penicillium angulare]KAJ5288704.1 hypothetical protein N7478_001734 [Penicillium angulare]
MSLQVNDPRSRSRSPGRTHERSRSRSRSVSRAPDTLDVAPSSSHQRSRSPAVVELGRNGNGNGSGNGVSNSSSSRKKYDSDDEAEIERQYMAMKESRARERERGREAEDRDARNANANANVNSTRAPSARYDLPRDRDRDRYEHSDDEKDLRPIQPPRPSYTQSQAPPPQPPRPPPSPSARNGFGIGRGRRDSSSSESSVDDDLAYGDTLGSHPSYARPGRFQYAAPGQMMSREPPRPSRQTDWASVPECERPGFVPPINTNTNSQGDVMPGAFPGSGPVPGAFPAPASTYAEVPGTAAPSFPPVQYSNLNSAQAQSPAQGHARTLSGQAGYAQPMTYQYAQVDPNVRYTSKTTPKPSYTASPEAQFSKLASDPYAHSRSSSQSQGQIQGHSQSQGHYPKQPEQPIYPYKYSHEPQFGDKALPPPSPRAQAQSRPQEQKFVEITPGGGRRPHSHSLSVSTNNLAVAGAPVVGQHPPASPLLEAYHGTYQSMSPMPSPIVIPSVRDDDISDLEPLDGDSGSDSRRRKKHTRTKSSTSEKDRERERDRDRDRERESRHRTSKELLMIERDPDRDRKDEKRRSSSKIRHSTSNRDSNSSLTHRDDSSLVLISPTTGRKRVSFYEADADAESMQSALNHTRNIDNKTIIQVLPRLTSDEILLLRQEYKNRVKVHGKGINLAKHLRLKLGASSFGKVAYATALGRWESEAYWANCYYQAGTSRRELLIESLIGRSNGAIREIKNSFRDTRYENSLEKCMRSELKADKFRVAVLLALEERRMDEREPLNHRLVRQDISDLHRALVSRDGGETAMIHIIVLRSDTHLREVLRAYEGIYGHNFAKAMIAKSRNLVGETLAHILNGAINRPMRDALLLHQALRESKSGRERSELLISRLVRLHWEPRHLEQVKIDYRRRYGERIEEAIAEEVLTSSNGGEWGEFCIELVHSSAA